MSKPAFKCLDCESYIVSISRNADGLHCPGCGGLIVPIPYEEFKYGIGIKRGKNKPLITIELEDIDSVPKIKFKGKELKEGIVRATFDYTTNDFNKHPTFIRLTTLSVTDNLPQEKTITVCPFDTDQITGEDFFNSI